MALSEPARDVEWEGSDNGKGWAYAKTTMTSNEGTPGRISDGVRMLSVTEAANADR